jgi:hypothetical protein
MKKVRPGEELLGACVARAIGFRLQRESETDLLAHAENCGVGNLASKAIEGIDRPPSGTENILEIGLHGSGPQMQHLFGLPHISSQILDSKINARADGKHGRVRNATKRRV